MKRAILAIAVWFGFVGTALAGYDEGYSAYWRGDYAAALAEFSPLAERGEADSQYMLGKMYAAGQGVLQDYVRAHLWLNLAAASGYGGAARARDDVADRMSPAQVAQAQRLARAWRPSTGAGTASTSSPATPSRRLVAEVQEHLAALDYDPGIADGLMGAKTRLAIRRYQRRNGLGVDGEATPALLSHLRETVAAQSAAPPAVVAKVDQDADGDDDEDDSAEELQTLVEGLKQAIAEARAKKQAEPALLAKLEKLIGIESKPKRGRLIDETFKDREYYSSPTWSVISGSFAVDPSGRLVSTVEAAPGAGQDQADAGDVAFAILGQVLGAPRQAGPQTPPAEIYLPQPFGGDFALNTRLHLNRDSVCEIGVVAGPARDTGYRLTLAAGQRPTLIRQDAGNGVLLWRAAWTLPNQDARAYNVRLRRWENGRFYVNLNGDTVAKLEDTAIGGPFSGVVHVNRLGRCAMQRLNVVVAQ